MLATSKAGVSAASGGDTSLVAHQVHALGRVQVILLWITVACCFATLLTTWPLWQQRTFDMSTPPNVPLLDVFKYIPVGWILVASLIVVLVKPRIGFWIFTVTYGIAVLGDLTRLQPQMFGLIVLLAACVWPAGRKFALWFLVAMWLWAGVHKLVSPYWLGPAAFSILDQMGIESARDIHIAFAWLVALAEISLGILALLRWRWAALLCVAVHAGIVGMLLRMDWNFAVLYWNVAIALVGAWLLWIEAYDAKAFRSTAGNSFVSSLIPGGVWQRVIAAILLVSPAGFYFGVTPHCLSHALYSDNLPKSQITSADQTTSIITWDSLHAPAPSERWYFQRYFQQVSKVGDKMHILDSRSRLDDIYLYRISDNLVGRISHEQFFDSDVGCGVGQAKDFSPALYRLELANCRMVRIKDDAPITSIKFDPELFEVELLESLPWLQNLQTVDLSGTSITDRDMSKLNRLTNLRTIELNDTVVTDEGLLRISGLKRLELVTGERTEITLEGVVDTVIRNTRR